MILGAYPTGSDTVTVTMVHWHACTGSAVAAVLFEGIAIQGPCIRITRCVLENLLPGAGTTRKSIFFLCVVR